MQKYNFNTIISFTFFAIVLIIAALFFVNLNLGFKVNGIIGDKESVDIYGSSVRISFKTPIDFGQNAKDQSEIPNLKNFITIEPNVDFGINITGSILTLNFKNTLDSNATYKIILNKNLTDIYGNNLKSDKTLEFKTRLNEFSFIERNSPDGNDRLIRININLENPEIIYSNKEDKIIDQFTKNHDYYGVLLEKNDKTSNIKIVNRKNKDTIDLNLENKKVKNVNLFKNSNKLLYVAYDVEVQGNFLAPKGFSKFYLYDIPTKSLSEVTLGGQTTIEPSEAIIAPDDKSILFQNDIDSQYYIFDINTSANLIGIGKQLQSGGFNYAGNNIVFVNFNPADPFSSNPYLAIYSSDRKETMVPDLVDYSIDPRFYSKSNDIIFSERRDEFEGTKGFFEIKKYNETDGSSLIVSSKDRSLELPKVSPDDRYVLIEEYSSKQLLDFSNQRSFEFQTKPFNGTLMIYDLINKKIIASGIKGINGSWEY